VSWQLEGIGGVKGLGCVGIGRKGVGVGSSIPKVQVLMTLSLGLVYQEASALWNEKMDI